MRAIWVGVLIAASVAAIRPAEADWFYKEDADPLTDQKTAVLAGDSIDGTIVGLKCWSGQPDETIISVMMGFNFAGSNDDDIPTKLRVDKNEVVDAVFSKGELANHIIVRGKTGDNPELTTVLDELSSAKKNLVVSFDSSIHNYLLVGFSKKYALWRASCAQSPSADDQ